MIDIAAIFFFSTLIVYTVARAIKFDKLIPWFSDSDPAPAPSRKKDIRR